MFLRSIRRATLVLLASTAITVACDDDDDDHGGEASPMCEELGEVCHEPGETNEMAQECHVIGHDGDAAACEMAYDECIAFCTGAGTGDSGGSSSSG
jgi:hypothetical protein